MLSIMICTCVHAVNYDMHMCVHAVNYDMHMCVHAVNYDMHMCVCRSIRGTRSIHVASLPLASLCLE